jgi:DNA-directed RNA polymerase subunit alpha
MRIRWRGLELPSQVQLDESDSGETYGRFSIEPFERGFGTTVGNGLRRILLSSLEGAAVVSMKINGADHEFTSLNGVLEDVTEIALNVKSLVTKLDADGQKKMTISVSGPGEALASQIEADPAITVINKDLVLATLTDEVDFEMEMTVASGRGYLTAAEAQAEEEEEEEIGVIQLDAVFSPVTRVRYKTEETRVGQRTNYDRLVMEIWTNGTILPEMALVEAAKILRKHLNPFVQYFELGDDRTPSVESDASVTAEVAIGLDPALAAKLKMSINDLDLSVRAGNCLESGKITSVVDLVRLTESELLKVRSFGRTSLREVKRKLADLDLSLGMEVPTGLLEVEGQGSPS